MIQESDIQKPGTIAEVFKTRPDGTVRFTHPDTGMVIIAKRGEIDLKTTKLIPVFDAPKKISR